MKDSSRSTHMHGTQELSNRARFHRLMNFDAVDRLPIVEWAPWWDKTTARWRREGLPRELSDGDIGEYLGLDMYRQCWIFVMTETFPEAEGYGKAIISDMDGYLQAKKELFPENAFDREMVEKWAVQQQHGEVVVWITLEGFFFFPRTLLGIENHLYAFYDDQELMHTMNRDVLEFNLRALDQFCRICRPDFMTFAEDMSYRSGPMISKSLFDEFVAPYYRQIVPKLEEYGIVTFIDSDGDIETLVPWFADLGIDGFLPLERQAGVDIARLRRHYPRLRMIGGYDKLVMSKGESEMRTEFERILPIMKQGGYIPSVDHQTPPDVSYENYKVYLELLREYSVLAVN